MKLYYSLIICGIPPIDHVQDSMLAISLDHMHACETVLHIIYRLSTCRNVQAQIWLQSLYTGAWGDHLAHKHINICSSGSIILEWTDIYNLVNPTPIDYVIIMTKGVLYVILNSNVDTSFTVYSVSTSSVCSGPYIYAYTHACRQHLRPCKQAVLNPN